MKTHLCIKTAAPSPEGDIPFIRKGDECTLRWELPLRFTGNQPHYEFEEHKGYAYAAEYFVPIENKPEISLSSEELEEFIKERTQERPDIVKQPKPQLA